MVARDVMSMWLSIDWLLDLICIPEKIWSQLKGGYNLWLFIMLTLPNPISELGNKYS